MNCNYIIVHNLLTVNSKSSRFDNFIGFHKMEVLDLDTIDKIVELLNEQGYSQKDLTDYLGIKKSVFSAWKSKKSKSYNKYISQIAVFFGVTPTELLDWESQSVSYGDRVRIIREEKGISQEELALRTGYPLLSIVKYENGDRYITDTVKWKILKALGISEQEIEHFLPHRDGMFDFRDDIDIEIDEMLAALNYDGKKKALEYLRDLAMLQKYTENADTEEGES